jgi:hypothetical protein
MAIQLRGVNRLPMPKNTKHKSPALVASYKDENQYCERCKAVSITETGGLGKLVVATETHHIVPGIYRTDEAWNLVRLCHECHVLCTNHQQDSALRENACLLIYKRKKGDFNGIKDWARVREMITFAYGSEIAEKLEAI